MTDGAAGPRLPQGHAAPGHAAPGHAAPGHAAPGHAAPGHAAPGHPIPEHAAEHAAAGRLDACLAFTLREEGGWSNDPHDPGGATQAGITLATFRAWRADPAATPAALRAIPPAEMRALYGALYWSAVGAPDLPPGVDLMAFDMAVNAGVCCAAKLLQRAAGSEPDGHVGPATLAAVRGAPLPTLLDGLASAHAAHYRALAGFPRYGRGWLARLDRRTALARRMAGTERT